MPGSLHRTSLLQRTLVENNPKLHQIGTQQLRSITTSILFQKTRALAYPIDSYWRRLQDRIPEEVPFNCNESTSGVKWRSEERPKSVHRLRPGDIDVVGAMGDSISSGNAAREFRVIGFVIEDRGVSFSGGGLGTWREFTTLPNILKVFNPKLVGYAVGRGDYLSYNAQLNVATPASIDDDTLFQAKIFVEKMRLHPKVDFESDWKLFTILVGHSDLCSLHCFNETRHSPEAHKYQLQRGLDYLYKNVPRLFVNVISVFGKTGIRN
ncbi:hypothetical protein J437_LFUL016031 [Ladona fulva]|uniref:Uncharacterized protein n=1 Tax=Ladona fulva TaxID=123851 RepID=A0A8K0KJY2_LADFU|nr:hypothetical protein J437_LFUL016031 [Ladona fulva]